MAFYLYSGISCFILHCYITLLKMLLRFALKTHYISLKIKFWSSILGQLLPLFVCLHGAEGSMINFIFLVGIDGGYSEWSVWSLCSTTCGAGVKVRSRVCNSPVPTRGAEDCNRLGSPYETYECNEGECPKGAYNINFFFQQLSHCIWILSKTCPSCSVFFFSIFLFSLKFFLIVSLLLLLLLL